MKLVMMLQEWKRQRINKLKKGLQAIADSALLRKREGGFFYCGHRRQATVMREMVRSNDGVLVHNRLPERESRPA